MNLSTPAHYQSLEFARVNQLMHDFKKQGSATLRILDYGCGTGKFLDLFCSLGMDASGVDINPEYIHRAVQKGQSAYDPEYFFSTDTPPYDIIFLSHLIEHLSPDELHGLIPKLCQKLSPHGKLIVLSPTHGERFYHDFTHIRPYLPQSFRHAFGATGMPNSYQEIKLLQLEDIYFFKDPYRPRYWRSFYKKTGLMPFLTRCTVAALDGMWRLSRGRCGVTASWLGVYVLQEK
ncbi:class I SAM-dependent methyltransferase [Comamonas terrigena]|uniref:class I SAM-dependent methyltransferase n=1 Tax=Comamonas terrigena TaxID=32013 RepID=UPI002354EEA5|nr:class I SAM-dependent methyltransferase [Comamonas terrigena]